MSDFRDPLPILFVIRSPDGEGVEIEILPIQIDALVFEQTADLLDQPVPRFLVSQIKQLALSVPPQQPLGVLLIQPGAGCNALRLKPDH
jgi:hypothetical protein